MEFSGMSVNIMFLKGTLDKLGIEPQIFYCGKFKSATEPLRLTKMSDANKLQTTEFITSFYQQFMKNIADSRKMSFDSLDHISKELLVRNPSSALKYGLVDGLKYYDEVLAELKKSSKTSEKNPLFVSIENYDNMSGGEKLSSSKNKIAVVYADGDIVDGKGDDDNIGSEKFAEMIRKIRQDEKVKALVLRVNSPGGSALASDIMWREIMLAKKKMPVIVSMGNYAASGGYYISCAADSIFAEPNTLTGSIGVFGILPCMEKFLEDKLGITHDGVKTGKYSDMPNLTRHFTEDEKHIIQAGVDSIYSDFLNRVAQGRHKTKAEIDSIAQGRVWSGEKAISIGLVDKLGDLDAAIACAVRAAKLKDFSVSNYPARDFGLKEILYKIGEDKKQTYIKTELGEYYQVFEQLQFIKKWTGIQARLPYNMDIR
jgi:protease-4